jgi:hypothetical protein
MYANSSMFINRSNTARATEERGGQKPSFLELMSHSNLWTELRGLSRRLHDQPVGGRFRLGHLAAIDLSFSSLPNQTKDDMKEMVYYALGNSTLASHDALLKFNVALGTEFRRAGQN